MCFKCFAKVSKPKEEDLKPSGKAFQLLGPATAKDLKPQSIRWLGTTILPWAADRLTALNATAGLVVDAGRRQHPRTPILQSLHWLPVKQRILYKIGIIPFHCVRGDGPAYLTEMFSRVSDTNLRSAARGDFVIPRTNTMTFGPRRFRVSGPTFGTYYLSILEIWTFPLCLKVNWKHFYSCEPSQALLRLS